MIITIIIALILKNKSWRIRAFSFLNYSSKKSGIPFYEMVASFFRQKGIIPSVVFLLLYPNCSTPIQELII